MFTNGILPEELMNYYDANRVEEAKNIENIFNAYMKELISNNQLDFGSMLYLTRNAIM